MPAAQDISMRFLVVDDSITMRRITVQALHDMGYTDVSEASTGQEGLDVLSSTPVDLIITDGAMPGMTGVEFVRQVRRSVQTSRIPVLMVSTAVSHAEIVDARRAGVNGYLVKPFTSERLREKVASVLAR
jgi:two-component system chemotaxis response regulator CheY